MKKLILLTFTILMTSNIAFADCKGITFKGKSGASYCLSKHMMNWYSASNWCQAQGMRLIDLKEDCGTLTGSCPELENISRDDVAQWTGNSLSSCFTNTSSSPGAVYRMLIGRGNIYDGHTRNTPAFAICK